MEEKKLFIIFGKRNGLWVIESTNVNDFTVLKEAEAKLDGVNHYIALFLKVVKEIVAALQHNSNLHQAYQWVMDCRYYSEQIKKAELETMIANSLVQGWNKGDDTTTEKNILNEHTKREELLDGLETSITGRVKPGSRFVISERLREVVSIHFLRAHLHFDKDKLAQRFTVDDKRTPDFYTGKVRKKTLTEVSCFVDVDIADEVIMQYIDENRTEIEQWVKNGSSPLFVPTTRRRYSSPIGYYFKRGQTSPQLAFELKLVFRKDKNKKNNYELYTAYIYP